MISSDTSPEPSRTTKAFSSISSEAWLFGRARPKRKGMLGPWLAFSRRTGKTSRDEMAVFWIDIACKMGVFIRAGFIDVGLRTAFWSDIRRL